MPEHLDPLLQDTPSGRAKLLAAWDGLSTETQIQILHKLGKTSGRKVCLKALQSSNTYVRYLAARSLQFDDEDPEDREILERIKNDEDPLVKYALQEGTFGFDSFSEFDTSPDKFWGLPHEERLARVRRASVDEELIAKIIEHAIDHDIVPEIEIFEVCADYLGAEEWASYHQDDHLSYEGFLEYSKGKGVENLWNLVPKAPGSVAAVLIENLPESFGLFDLRSSSVKNWPDAFLYHLLKRKDIGLSKLRKKLFLDKNTENSIFLSAAARWNLELTYKDFSVILNMSKEKRDARLTTLAFSDDLDLVFYDALHDYIKKYEMWSYADITRDKVEERLGVLSGWKRERQIQELKIYRWAKELVFVKNESGDVYGEDEKGKEEGADSSPFKLKDVVRNDPWATFMKFSEAFASCAESNRDAAQDLLSDDDLPELWGESGVRTRRLDKVIELPQYHIPQSPFGRYGELEVFSISVAESVLAISLGIFVFHLISGLLGDSLLVRTLVIVPILVIYGAFAFFWVVKRHEHWAERYKLPGRKEAEKEVPDVAEQETAAYKRMADKLVKMGEADRSLALLRILIRLHRDEVFSTEYFSSLLPRVVSSVVMIGVFAAAVAVIFAVNGWISGFAESVTGYLSPYVDASFGEWVKEVEGGIERFFDRF